MSQRRDGTPRAARGAMLPRRLASSAIPLGVVIGVVTLVDLPMPWHVAGEAQPPAAAADSAPSTQPVAVLTAVARRGDLVMTITATGSAEAARQLRVVAAQGGALIEVPVREGDMVTAGDLLAAVDDTVLRLGVQKARESLVTAIARFTEKSAFLTERNEDAVDPLEDLTAAQDQFLAGSLSAQEFRVLIDDPRFDALFQTITRQEVMAAQDRLMTERANFTQADLDLQRARTHAPFGGQVGELQVVVGQWINAGSELLTLVDAEPIRVRVEVLESEAGRVRLGRGAEVRFAAYPGEVFVGQVEAISPLVDPDNRTLAAAVSLPNPGLRLKPGMHARIELDTEILTDRVLVPADAVLLRDERPMVFVVRDERAQWVYIEQGRDNGESVEVLKGVAPGEEVIVSGHYSLAHDAAVRVIEADADGHE